MNGVLSTKNWIYVVCGVDMVSKTFYISNGVTSSAVESAITSTNTIPGGCPDAITVASINAS